VSGLLLTFGSVLIQKEMSVIVLFNFDGKWQMAIIWKPYKQYDRTDRFALRPIGWRLLRYCRDRLRSRSAYQGNRADRSSD
jgi:hypothetical protein